VDPAFQKKDFGFAILHRSDGGEISVACVLRWTGSKAAPLNFDLVGHDIYRRLQQYGVNALVGDQHGFAILSELFLRLGIFYREFTFGSGTRAALFGICIS
jgi:hypothetical protein